MRLSLTYSIPSTNKHSGEHQLWPSALWNPCKAKMKEGEPPHKMYTAQDDGHAVQRYLADSFRGTEASQENEGMYKAGGPRHKW